MINQQQRDSGSQLTRRALERVFNFPNSPQRLLILMQPQTLTRTVQNLVLLSFRHVGVSPSELK